MIRWKTPFSLSIPVLVTPLHFPLPSLVPGKEWELSTSRLHQVGPVWLREKLAFHLRQIQETIV